MNESLNILCYTICGIMSIFCPFAAFFCFGAALNYASQSESNNNSDYSKIYFYLGIGSLSMGLCSALTFASGTDANHQDQTTTLPLYAPMTPTVILTGEESIA